MQKASIRLLTSLKLSGKPLLYPKELRSFLGRIMGNFISNLSTLLHPLNRLLQYGTNWNWSPECAQAFKSAKDMLTSSSVLVHYDPSLPLCVAADTSAFDLGAVLSQVMQDGSERPVVFASITLTPSEKSYAQVEKDALIDLRCQEVPFLPFWQTFHTPYRLQAIHHYCRFQEANPHYGCS